jgi:hypothetical protein
MRKHACTDHCRAHIPEYRDATGELVLPASPSSNLDLQFIRKRHADAQDVADACRANHVGDNVASGWFTEAHGDRAALLAEIDRMRAVETNGKVESLRSALRGLLEIEDARIGTGAFKPNDEARRRIDRARSLLDGAPETSCNSAPSAAGGLAPSLPPVLEDSVSATVGADLAPFIRSALRCLEEKPAYVETAISWLRSALKAEVPTPTISKPPQLVTGAPTCERHGVELAFEGDECWECKREA